MVLSILWSGSHDRPADVAAFSLALTLGTVAFGIVAWGTERSAFLVDAPTARRATTRLKLYVFCVTAPLVIAIAEWVSVLEYTIGILLYTLAAVFDVEHEYRRARQYGVAQLARPIAAGALAGASFALGAGPVPVAAWGAGALASTLFLRKRAPFHPGRDRPRPRVELRPFLLRGVTALTAPIAYFADQVLLAGLRGLEELADYALAYRVVTAMVALFAISQAVWVPRIVADRSAVRGYLAFNLGLCVIQGALVITAAHLGPTYLQASTDRFTSFVLLLGLQLPLIAIADPLSRRLALQTAPRLMAILDVASACAAIVGYAALIPRYGALGAVAGTLLTFAVHAVMVVGAWIILDGREDDRVSHVSV